MCPRMRTWEKLDLIGSRPPNFRRIRKNKYFKSAMP